MFRTAELVHPRLPAVSMTARAAEGVSGDPREIRPAAAVDLNRAAAEITATLQTSLPLDRRQARLAPWCLWQTKPALAENRELLMALLRAAAQSTSARPFGRLAAAYAREFHFDAPHLSVFGRSLGLIAKRQGGKWLALQDTVAIFDVDMAPRRLAEAALAVDRPVAALLSEAGLGDMEANGGLAAMGTAAVLQALADGAEPDAARRLERVRQLALDALERPYFDGQQVAIITALLRPFHARSSDKAIRDEFLRLIIGLLGDPRLRPGQWTAVPADLRQLVIHWLTEQSLRQFLDIVDQITNRDNDSERMFRFRRAFWESVHAEKLIDEAWVAFGPAGTHLAKRIFGDRTESAVLEKQKKPVLVDHAVLLLRIGGGVVAEWSHLGQCNVWFDWSDSTAPKLFELKYGSDDVRVPDTNVPLDERKRVAFSHQYSDRFTWQRKAAGYLYQMTGRRLNSADWAPK